MTTSIRNCGREHIPKKKTFLEIKCSNRWSQWAWEVFQEKLVPFPQASSLFSLGAVDSTANPFGFLRAKREWKTCVHSTQMLAPAHCCLLSDLRGMVEPRKAICMQGPPSAEEQSSWRRWGSLPGSGWRGALIPGAYSGRGLGAQSKRLICPHNPGKLWAD